MGVVEAGDTEMVVSHHKGFGPDEIDMQRKVDMARMRGHNQEEEYKKFLAEEKREREILTRKRARGSYNEEAEAIRASQPMYTRHNGQNHIRHFNNNNQDEMEEFFIWLVYTLIGCLFVGIAAIIAYNSCMRVKRAVNYQGSSDGEQHAYYDST